MKSDDSPLTEDLTPPIVLRRKARAMPAQVRKLIGPEFAHKKTAQGFLAAWKAMRHELYLGHVLPFRKLPTFCTHYMKLLYDTGEEVAMAAVKMGDVAFFIAWLFRLDQIDCEMIRLKYTVADRVPLIRARMSVDGYRDIAEKRLKRLGGRWPPTSPNDTVLR